MKIEEFTRIKDFDNYYINSNGVIIRVGFKTIRVIKGKIDKNGYNEVGIYNNDEIREFKRVHRLVAEAFIPNPNNFPIVNHIDGDKLNNSVGNLEWTTVSGNTLHSFRVLGRTPKATTNKPVTFKNITTGEVISFISVNDAADYFKYSSRQMSRLINGKADISKSKIKNYELVK